MRLLSTSVAALALAGSSAFAAAVIDNGTVMLGVDDFGQLNIPGAPSPVDGTPFVGLRYIPTGNESTSHGCLCEGWGVGIADTGASGSANNNFGVSNLTLNSFASTASTATSDVSLSSGELNVVHTFAGAVETDDLYRVSVAITNTSGVDITDLRYTRTFDWDVEPDTFTEFVTHGGVVTTPTVLSAVDNGFVDSDPFGGGRTEIVLGGTGDFVDLGPADHGSNFDFGFGALASGDTFEFEIFYGGSATEVGALAALGAVGAEVYSLGQCAGDRAGTGAGGCNTFSFGFAGVGGVPIPVVPIPASGLLILSGLGALGALRRRKQSKA